MKANPRRINSPIAKKYSMTIPVNRRCFGPTKNTRNTESKSIVSNKPSSMPKIREKDN